MRICPDCGETCAHDWCGFCERALPHADSPFPQPPLRSCATGHCTDPNCYICVVMQEKFRVVPCPRHTADGDPCRFIAGHPPPCKGKPARKAQGNTLRDGDAKTKKRDPTFTPRRRVGPHR